VCLAEARPSVQQDQRRIPEALAADQDPLIDSAKPEIANLRDAPGLHLSVWAAKIVASYPDASCGHHRLRTVNNERTNHPSAR
jgi:hypothetical protein